MSNLIETVKIKGLFDEKDVNWSLKKVNVLVGKNGSGKSTILKLIHSAITGRKIDEINLCEEVILEMDNKETYKTRNPNILNIDLLQMVIDIIATEEGYNDKSSHTSLKYKHKPYKNDTNLSEFTKDLLRKINIEIKADDDFIKIDNKLPNTNEKIENMCVEYISTINMSANSITNIIESNGNKTTFLDIEIDREIERLNKNYNTKLSMQEKLKESLNKFFEETNKKVIFTDDQIAIILGNGRIIEYSQLSSGERQLIFIFLKVINGSTNRALILMDEPEISLHLSWQEKLLKEITNVNSESQLIVVTHSPALVMNGWLETFIDIKDIIE